MHCKTKNINCRYQYQQDSVQCKKLDDILKKYKKKIPSNELINIFVEDFFEDTEFKHFDQIYYNGYLGQLDKRNLNLIELNYQTIQEKKK